ncbi:2-phospho-L-lactate guanylyltransferase [Gordonia polyisoprenivorans]|uniref:2-phospho-L-lactate guanylyltransferase n=1 Tax=Gordonia polyisoprenivorans TaxID=84595 RepID=UPI001FCBE227|nr:2-phospho-L-lactate guanylyltransferase [Gordonia polyisoprenivorans]
MGGEHSNDHAQTPAVAAVLVVKHLRAAKTRLAASRLAPSVTRRAAAPALPATRIGEHGELVLSMLLDTLAAVRSAGLAPIVVVSPDDDVLRAVDAAGARALPEIARPDSSLNHAYAQGTQWIQARHREVRRVLMVQADLPAADAASIRAVLDECAEVPYALITDAGGDGTALLLRPADDDRLPRFGIGSAAAHRADGALEIDPAHRRWPDLRTDVDTAADLEAAVALGVGDHTRAVLGLDGPIARVRRRGEPEPGSEAAARRTDAS